MAGVVNGLVGWMRVVLCLRSGDVGIRTVGGVGVYREGVEGRVERWDYLPLLNRQHNRLTQVLAT